MFTGNPDPKLFISEWTIPTKVNLEFNFYVEPLVQAQWITDGLRLAEELPSIYAVGWIHLYDEPPTSYGGLLETDGEKKPGYCAWKSSRALAVASTRRLAARLVGRLRPPRRHRPRASG